MPVTLARCMDAVAICTCSLPTAGLPRHLPLTLSLLPRTASPTTGRRRRPRPRQPPPGAPAPRPAAEVQRFARSANGGGGRGGYPQDLPGSAGGREPEPGGGEPIGRGRCAFPGEPDPAGVCSGVWREHPAQKAPQSLGCFLWLGARCGNASWLASPRWGFFIFTLLKKSVTKANKTPKLLRDITPVHLLLNLDADRTSLQCRKSNTTIKGNICLQLRC